MQQRGSMSNCDDKDLQRVRDRLEEHAKGTQTQHSQMKRNDADAVKAVMEHGSTVPS